MGERSGAAVRQAAYRQRQKAKAAAAEAEAKQARGYSWAPFTEANTAAVVHGAASARFRDPLAARIIEELLGGPDCPPHVREPRFAAALQAWGRQQAIVELLVRFVAGLVEQGGLEGALAERVEGSEETAFGKGRSSKRTRLQRLESAVAALDRAERRCQSLRADLLLSPASAARAGMLSAGPANLMATPEYLAAVSRSGQEVPGAGSDPA